LPCLAAKRVADHFIDRDAKSNAPDAIRPENYYKSCWADEKYLKALLVEHGSYFPKTHKLPTFSRLCQGALDVTRLAGHNALSFTQRSGPSITLHQSHTTFTS
jgi:hypothetical protein